jgi:zinc protease
VRLIDKPDATQSQIAILGPGIKHADADLCATRLMDYSLGGGSFSSRLMRVVRSENAKTYGARSTFEAHREPGAFEATTFTRAPETASTIGLVLGEIEHMRKDGPAADELQAAKANMIGGYGLHFETGADVARQLVVADLDRLPADFAVTYPRCLESVTLVDAAKAAQEHLHPQALVVVGNAESVAPLLTAAKLAPSETVLYTDPVSATERTTDKKNAPEQK